jgi:hypothetical protein
MDGQSNGKAVITGASSGIGAVSGKHEHRTIKGGIGHNLPQGSATGLCQGCRRRRWLLTWDLEHVS